MPATPSLPLAPRPIGHFTLVPRPAAASRASAKNMPADFRVSITNPPGKDAYPIASFTWLLIPSQSADAQKGKILAGFLTWMLADGQRLATQLHYAPLPKEVSDKVRATIGQIR